MKYSVRGSIDTADGAPIVAVINNYALWRLVTEGQFDETFTFEAWVNTEAAKTALFDDLKPFVAAPDDFIDWHECTHDEANPQPCMIAETYKAV